MSSFLKGYQSIRVSTLRGDQPILFDAYVKVSDKLILYCRKGDSFEGARLDRLMKRKLNRMFIKQTDYENYKKYLTENYARAFESSQGQPLEVRCELATGIARGAADDLMDEPYNEAFYEICRKVADLTTQFLINEPEAFAKMLSIKNEHRTVSHHGVHVAVLTLGMALEEKSLSEKRDVLSHLVLGGFIHDIGQAHDILEQSEMPVSLKGREREFYKQHCLQTQELMKNTSCYDPLVRAIIEQHEETIDGRGYPDGLKEDEVEEEVWWVAVANAYDRYVTFKGEDPKVALKQLLIEQMGVLPLEKMQTLQRFLKGRNIVT